MKEELDLQSRFRVLAGIVQNDTLATLQIPKTETIIQLKYIPNWFEMLKYKMCGFKCTIIRTEPTQQLQDVVNTGIVEFEK
jgi:hypothetical protein